MKQEIPDTCRKTRYTLLYIEETKTVHFYGRGGQFDVAKVDISFIMAKEKKENEMLSLKNCFLSCALEKNLTSANGRFERFERNCPPLP
ncbi:MAG: hypothetical protein IJ635_00120 [Bacteroidaceae bacterium]|nr:hypothetical protein [Bacteroidaceae bacterium]